MREITLPGTDLRVSQICLGSAEFGLKLDRDGAFSLMDTLVSRGGNFIDTAHCYSDWVPGEVGRSEKIIGDWIKKRKNRSSVVLATKGGIDFTLPGTPISLSEAELDKDIEESLANLQTDYIDLYWLHRDERGRPVDEIINTLNKHVWSGRIRYIGCSNWNTDRIHDANAYAFANGLQPFIASQIEWSLARMFLPERPIDTSMPFMDPQTYEFHKDTHFPALAFTAQARGFFSILDKFGEEALSEFLRFHYLNDRNRKTYQRLKELASKTGDSVTSLCLSFISSQPEFTGVPIIYAGKMVHLLDSLAGANTVLTPEQITYLLTE